MSNAVAQPFRIRSYVGRNSRISPTQRHACTHLFNDYGLTADKAADFKQIFAREAPTFLEIGFGSGQSLFAAAQTMPEYNFIGVETHRPGVGSLLNHLKLADMSNVRVYQEDVVDVLERAISDATLQGVQIFFPDPWPKRRHHERRLIQPEFVRLLVRKLCAQGTLHIATDWEDYAAHILRVLSACTDLCATKEQGRSPFRPIITKFEKRALREGRAIWEFQYRKV